MLTLRNHISLERPAFALSSFQRWCNDGLGLGSWNGKVSQYVTFCMCFKMEAFNGHWKCYVFARLQLGEQADCECVRVQLSQSLVFVCSQKTSFCICDNRQIYFWCLSGWVQLPGTSSMCLVFAACTHSFLDKIMVRFSACSCWSSRRLSVGTGSQNVIVWT